MATLLLAKFDTVVVSTTKQVCLLLLVVLLLFYFNSRFLPCSLRNSNEILLETWITARHLEVLEEKTIKRK